MPYRVALAVSLPQVCLLFCNQLLTSLIVPLQS